MNAQLQFNKSFRTDSNIIDVTVLRNQNSIVYSMDTSHQAFSIDALTDIEKQSSRSLMGSLTYYTDSKTWKENQALQAGLVAATRECADSQLHVPQAGAAKEKSLKELLYGLESLRKRGSEIETDV